MTPKTEHIPGFHESIAKMPIENKRYVDMSIAIAHKVHSKIKELNITSNQLAEKLDTTEQEVEEMFGQLHNLRTITRLETILKIQLININESIISNNTPVTQSEAKGSNNLKPLNVQP